MAKLAGTAKTARPARWVWSEQLVSAVPPGIRAFQANAVPEAQMDSLGSVVVMEVKAPLVKWGWTAIEAKPAR